MKSAIWIVLVALIALAFRCHNYEDVFVGRGIYFVDADCYSRMSRVEKVVTGSDLVVDRHLFENWPAGTTPHTTAPMDYLIAGLYWVIQGGMWVVDAVAPGRFEEWILGLAKSETGWVKETARVMWVGWNQRLDFAGALVSPLLGFATCLFLGWWARRILGWWARWGQATDGGKPRVTLLSAVPILFAVSPILVHGTILGRPDHQALLLLTIALALAAELRLGAGPSAGWSIAGGIAWGLALWVSLYEPLVIFAVSLVIWLVAAPRRLWEPQRRPGWLAFVLTLIVALAIDGWRVTTPASEFVPFLANWSKGIGELQPLKASSPLLFRWLGQACLIAPVLLAVCIRWDRRGVAALALLIVLFALTTWQLRWGYFLALVFAMSLAWVLSVPSPEKLWIRWALRIVLWAAFLGSLWPIAREWDERLFPGAEARRQLALQRSEMEQLRELSEKMRGPDVAPFLAPWWHSPRIAYWSGQPGVAGSSHQSISGIVDTARFYLAEKPQTAAALLKAHGVAHVLGDEPGRVISSSEQVLGIKAGSQPLARRLMSDPYHAAPFLVPTFSSRFFKVFSVDQSKLTP